MKKEIQIGLLTLLTTVIVVWGYNFIIGKNLFAKEKSLTAIFNNVQDLAVSSQVIVSGLPVGSVTAIELNPENVREIYVTLTVASKIKIPKTAKAVLKNQSVMGAKVIELMFEKMCAGADCAVDGDVLEAYELGLISSILDPSELDPFIKRLGPSMDTILNKFNSEEANPTVYEIIKNMHSTMQNLSSLTGRMDKLMAHSSSNLNKITKNLAEVSQTVSDSQTKISSMIDNFSQVSEDLSQVSISNTMAKTDKAIDQANTTLLSLETSMTEAKTAINELGDVLTKIDDSTGSLGMMVNDKELYYNLESTSKNLSLLLQDLRLNPKRYVNVSVFGKKSKEYTLPEADPASINK